MRTINLTKIVTMLLITMLICSMMFEMAYANTLLVESRTVGNMELELEKHITKNKPEIEIGSEEYITYLCELLTFEDDEILAKNTGKSIKQIENDTDRDNYLTANDAKDYGLVDKILTTAP